MSEADNKRSEPREAARSATANVVCLVLLNADGAVLATQRPEGKSLGGFWEFPGGKIQDGETAEAACVREMKEEVNLTVRIDLHLCRVRHAYTHFRISADVFVCRLTKGRIRLNGPEDHRWISLKEIHRFPFPKANHKFIPLLLKDPDILRQADAAL